MTETQPSTQSLPRLVVELPPGCEEARIITIIEAGIAMLSQLCGEDLSARPWKVATKRTRRERKPRRLTLASVAKQVSKAAIEVARYEIKADGSVVVVTGAPEPAAPENPWLVELRRKETKR